MADKFDPYREALVMETATIWPADVAVPAAQRRRIEILLHEKPQEAGHIDYFRTHTGFSRQITVTPADLARLQ